MAHFRLIRLIRLIRWRITGGSKNEYSTTILALFAGKWGPILRSTLKKPKENQGFWLQPLKNLRKIKVFGYMGPLGPYGAPMWPHGVPMGPHGLSPGLPWAPMGPYGPHGPWPHGAQGGPMGPRGYIGKLPINRLNGGMLV